MEANQILQSDILDILFEGKNKSYGAYDLRKTYHKRIETALAVVLLLIVAAIVSSFMVNKFRDDYVAPPLVSAERTIIELPKDEPKPIPLPKPKPMVHVATAQYTVPVITKSELVVDPPIDVKELEKVRIDISTSLGKDDVMGAVNPPENLVGSNVVEKPASGKTKEEGGFRPVEIEAAFPGGDKAWQRYIQKAITSQLDEFTDSDYGTCMVRFIVDKSGNVSEVTATTMQGSKLAEIAINTIRKGPNWTPAIQNGLYVKATRLQPVTLLNPNE